MAIYDLYSKRKRIERGQVPDVYQYDKSEQSLKVQIMHIIADAFGDDRYNDVQALYQKVINILCREHGIFELLQYSHLMKSNDHLLQYFLQEKNLEKSFDVVELCFLLIDSFIRDNYSYQAQASPRIDADDAIAELNDRFKEHAFGYKYESGIIIKVSSEYICAQKFLAQIGNSFFRCYEVKSFSWPLIQ